MIAQATIDKVREAADIEQIVSKHVELKKHGQYLKGLCPFHEEKTPSFTVSNDKGIYKCFGCGASGDAVRFLQEKEKMEFHEAIQELAQETGTMMEYEGTDQSQQHRDERDQIYRILAWAQQQFAAELRKADCPAHAYLQQRGWTDDIITDMGIGYAPEAWKTLTDTIIQTGWHETALKAGLINSKNGNTYDVFRHRLIFPIYNRNGRVVGFGGRSLPDADGNEQQPKYINSAESPVYKKEKVLYGLGLAKKAIREANIAYLVEGYADVIAMHDYGYTNTVASCGTALTEAQARELAKHCSQVTIMRDGDDAGQQAAMKDIDILLAQGLKVGVIDLMPQAA